MGAPPRHPARLRPTRSAGRERPRELQRPEPALPISHTEQDATRRVTPDQPAQLLAAWPDGRATRIRIARVIGESFVPGGTENGASFVEYRNLDELGGFVVSGPASVAEIVGRVGAGERRVTAYGLDVPALRWEIFVTLDDEMSPERTPWVGQG